MMLEVASASGARVINSDRMWHYPEGIDNYAPIWPRHGIRILSGPSPLWLDARGKRLPVPLFPGFDCLGALEQITAAGFEHSWFLLNQRIIGKEFALSGSEQNPDLTGKSVLGVLKRGRGKTLTPVQKFVNQGRDFLVGGSIADLVGKMNQLVGERLIDAAALEAEVAARDREIDNKFGKDAQVMAIRAARKYIGDRLIRVAKPHKLTDPAAGPLIAVRLWDSDAQDAGRSRDGSLRPRAAGGQHAASWCVRGGRGRGLRRRRRARLPRAGRNVSRRLPIFRARRRPRRGDGGSIKKPPSRRAIFEP